MAKVMISMPDELLERLDAAASARGITRSGYMQELARARLDDDAEARQARIGALLARARSFDGRGTQHVREMRDAR